MAARIQEATGQETTGPEFEGPAWQDIYHIGPGTLAGRYLRRWWHPVYLARQLQPGYSKPIRILGEDLTLYRGADGAPHLVAFRCAHRGTQLSTGWVEGDNIRCFYHGWVYGPDGQCIEQPAEPEPFCQRIRIQSYPVQEYLGLIFAFLGEGAAPALPHYADLEDEGVLETMMYTWPCSYFNSLENGLDHVHIAFVHRDLRAELGLVGVPRVAAEETDWGVLHAAVRADGGQRNVLSFWPNMNRRKSGPPHPDLPWTESMAWRVPVDDTHFSSFGVNLVHITGERAIAYQEARAAARARPMVPATVASEAVLRGEYRVWDVEDRRILNGVQDYTAQVGQGAIPERGNWHLASSDVAVVLLRNIWYRELRAMAEGKPLKEWKNPDGFAPTSGLAE